MPRALASASDSGNSESASPWISSVGAVIRSSTLTGLDRRSNAIESGSPRPVVATARYARQTSAANSPHCGSNPRAGRLASAAAPAPGRAGGAFVPGLAGGALAPGFAGGALGVADAAGWCGAALPVEPPPGTDPPGTDPSAGGLGWVLAGAWPGPVVWAGAPPAPGCSAPGLPPRPPAPARLGTAPLAVPKNRPAQARLNTPSAGGRPLASGRNAPARSCQVICGTIASTRWS